jgi:choline kinase
MVFIILAAGMGVRANSQELNCPKVLLKAANGKSLLLNMLEKIQTNISQDTRIHIVVGFLYEQIIEEVETYKKSHNFTNIDIVHNEQYERGVITSLFRGLQGLNDDVVILNGDTYYSSNLFVILKSIQRSTLLVMPADEAPDSVRVATDNDSILCVGKNLEEYSYISTGCLFLEGEHAQKTTGILENLINRNAFGRMIWHNIINMLVGSGESISYKVMGSNSIFEIDTTDDYQSFLAYKGG